MRQLLNYVGRFPNEEEMDKLRSIVETDKNKKLDFDAFLKVMEVHNAKDQFDEEMKAAFKVMDKVPVSSCIPLALDSCGV